MSTEEPETDGSNPGQEAAKDGENPTPQAYIDDPEFTGSVDAVQQHYQQVRPVFEEFADLDGAPTTGFFGNFGWYRSTYQSDDDGNAVVHRRAYTFEEDYGVLVDAIEYDASDSSWRSAYNIASWKDSDAVYRGATKRDSSELGQGVGLAGYDSMRGFPLWVDLDLEDNEDGEEGPNYKRRRGDLSDDVRGIVERAYQAYAEEFADLCGIESDDVAVFDSGGGGYLYTPAAVTLPIADHYADDEGPHGSARALIFEELRERFYAYGTGAPVNKSASDYGFTGIQNRVNERVDGAADVLNPDWMQNRNRQSKAPLAIHGDHDVVVTPARPVDGSNIVYEPTLVSDVDEQLIGHTIREVKKILTIPDDDVLEDWADSFVETLFHDYDTGDWRETLDEWLADVRAQKRKEVHQRAIEQRRQRERLQSRVGDTTSEDAKTTGQLLTEIDVTPVRQDVFDVLDGATVQGAEFTTRKDVRDWWADDDDELIVDVRDVIQEYATDEWLTADRGHEVTFRPCWRSSNSGESCAVPRVSVNPDTGEVSAGNGFVDNKCNGSGDPAKAYALGTGIIEPSQDAAAHSLNGKQWADAIEGLRDDGYPIPIFIPEAGSKDADGETYEKTPLWGLRKAAVALDVCDKDDFVEHETDDGETYLGFDGATYDAVLRAVDAAGIDHGREPIGTDTRSAYYDADLDEFVDDGDPWTDPDTMLRACLRARDADVVPSHAAPPKLALLPLRRDVLGQQASRDMTDGTESLLKDLFDELNADELDDVIDAA